MKNLILSAGRIWVACFLIALALMSAGAASAEQRAKASVAGPEKAAAGKPFDITVSIDIQPGYHIQANNAKDPYIPTKVDVTAPEGFKVGTPVFPESKVIDSFGEKLAVFEGKISVKVPITPPASAKGAQEIGVKVDYQACNDTACDPPAKTSASTEINVTPVASKAPPVKKPAPKKKVKR